MSDLYLVSNLASPSSRVLQALENAGLFTVDLLTLDVFEIHRRTQLSVIDVQNLVKDVISAMSRNVESEVKTAQERIQDFSFLTSGDETINGLLGGGIPTGSLTEVTGESGLGKSQLCLQLCIHVQLPQSLGGLDAGAIYVGTESSLATPRLSQIAESLTSTLTTNPPDVPEEDVNAALTSLSSHGDRILYYHCADLESQEHIVTYQLSVLLSRYRIGLIILDSVTANYRAEFDLAPTLSQKSQSQAAQMAQRSKDLRKLAGILKDLAVQWNVAVVVVNQVTDTFTRSLSQGLNSTPDEDLLSSNYQARWFDGLIDEYGEESTKKPALGLVWSNLITSRIMLVRDNDGRSRLKVVFSPFAKQGSLLYEISSEAGIHAVTQDSKRTKETKVVEVEGIQEDIPRDDAGTSDIDLKAYDIEFSDFDIEDVLSEQPNI